MRCSMLAISPLLADSLAFFHHLRHRKVNEITFYIDHLILTVMLEIEVKDDKDEDEDSMVLAAIFQRLIQTRNLFVH